MSFKSFFFSFFLFIFLTGCSSINHSDLGDFLTDTASNDNDSDSIDNNSAEKPDPVLESTRAVLQASPAPQLARSRSNDPVEAPIQEQDFDDVWKRLASTFQLSDIEHQRIQIHKDWYLKHKSYLGRVSERAQPYLYLIAEEVEKRNIPGEIALLPIIESAFRTDAYSKQNAAGLWQFVPATGRHFGLKQNWWFDGRRDIQLSTHAALTYLVQLNKYYKGDWLLALAAYNAGAGNVNKAVRKNRQKGKAIDYWSLDLPRETKNYVPKLLAVAQLVLQAEHYDISLYPIDNTAQLMLVDTESQIDLSLVSRLTGLNVNEIKSYNPAIKRWATDPEGPHHLLLPIEKAAQFETQLALVDEKDRIQHYRHKIRSGESLSVIAHKYNLSTQALKKANHLKNNRIRAGKYLMIPLPGNTDIAALTKSQKKVTNKSRQLTGQTYTVRKGDSFWTIARRYKMSHRQLASLNEMTVGDTLSIGQQLLIKPHTLAAQDKSARTSTSSSGSTSSQEINYKVKQGDSLYVISKRFNVSITELKRWNDLQNNKYLQPGQELKVFINSQDSQPI